MKAKASGREWLEALWSLVVPWHTNSLNLVADVPVWRAPLHARRGGERGDWRMASECHPRGIQKSGPHTAPLGGPHSDAGGGGRGAPCEEALQDPPGTKGAWDCRLAATECEQEGQCAVHSPIDCGTWAFFCLTQRAGVEGRDWSGAMGPQSEPGGRTSLWTVHSALLVAQALAGGSYVVTKVAPVHGMDRVVLTLYRDVLAVFILFPAAFIFERWAPLRPALSEHFCAWHTFSERNTLVEMAVVMRAYSSWIFCTKF